MTSTGKFRLVFCVAVIGMWIPVCAPAAEVPQHWRRLIQLWEQPMGHEEPVKCGLPLIAHALRTRPSLSTLDRASLESVLMRPSTQTSILAGNYRIHFDTVGVNAPAFLDAQGQPIAGTARKFVDSTVAALVFSTTIETNVLGYPTAPSDGSIGGGPEYDVYIQELGSMYGYTTPDQTTVPGERSTSFITIDNDFAFVNPPANRGGPALRVTVAHELHHAIQIGRYGYWGNEVYFYEMTSTWMEDVVYPEVNDYYNYLKASWGHFKNPEKTFTSNDLIMYSRAIWCHFLAKRFSIDAVRTCWENISSTTKPLQAIDAALHQYTSSFASAYSEWVQWNYFTDTRADPLRYYTEGAAYPDILQTLIYFTTSSRELSSSLNPLGTRYYDVRWQADSMTVILANIDFAAALSGSGGTPTYSYTLQTQRIDDSYTPTPIGLFAKLVVANPVTWGTWYITGDSIRPLVNADALEEGFPFPNPFKADGNRRIYFPVDAAQQASGKLYIYTSSMNLVYESPELLPMVLSGGRQVFMWDGKTMFSEVAPSGVYVFVVELRDRRVTGKIALLKE